MLRIVLLAALVTVALSQGYGGYGNRGYGGYGNRGYGGYGVRGLVGHGYGGYGGHGGYRRVGLGHRRAYDGDRGYNGGYAPAYGHGGYGGHDYAQPTPYDFGYDVHGHEGDQQHRKESGDGHGNVQGSYGYRDAHGLYRQVDYVADHYGFRANVKTNEPGTANQNPADVHVQSEQGYNGRY